MAMSILLGLKTKISIKLFQDSRFSRTLISTRSAAGVTGSTIFALKGQRRNELFTDDF